MQFVAYVIVFFAICYLLMKMSPPEMKDDIFDSDAIVSRANERVRKSLTRKEIEHDLREWLREEYALTEKRMLEEYERAFRQRKEDKDEPQGQGTATQPAVRDVR